MEKSEPKPNRRDLVRCLVGWSVAAVVLLVAFALVWFRHLRAHDMMTADRFTE